MTDAALVDPQQLQDLDPEELRRLVETLLDRQSRDAQEIATRNAKIDKLTFKVAQLRRLQFGHRGERMNVEQRMLFEESVTADIASSSSLHAALPQSSTISGANAVAV